MAKLLAPALLFLVSVAATASRPDNPHKQSTHLKSLAKRVNSNANAPWHASETIAELRSQNAHLHAHDPKSTTIDWRKTSLLRSIDDQGNCGSCWAFASTHAFDDYRSIVAQSKQTDTSMDRVTSCCTLQDCQGCDGAGADSAFAYLNKRGTVPDVCQPYDDDDLMEKYGLCQPTCDGGTVITEALVSKFKLGAFSRVTPSTPENIKRALRRGPVVGSILVYQDLTVYSGGIYQKSLFDEYGDFNYIVGRHLIEIVGYGRSRGGLDYWIVKNSWGVSWGEGGYFRMVSGNDSDFGIERQNAVYAPFDISDGSVESTASRSSSGVHVGGSEEVSIDADDVIEAARFGAYEIEAFCPGVKLNQTVRNVTLIEVKRAARKIVRGGHITLTATYQEPGCPQTTTYEFVVVLGIDGQYNLVRSTYLPTTVAPPSSKTSAGFRYDVNWMVITVLLLLSLVFNTNRH